MKELLNWRDVVHVNHIPLRGDSHLREIPLDRSGYGGLANSR